jgi:2-dehydro-3-deoxyphosphogluconate aldolase/(4S)-4-hydroxy-2-oxoglutarate aldolase
VDPETKRVPEGIEHQTHQVLRNIRSILEAGGVSMNEVLKVTAHLADLSDFDAFNRVYKEYFREPYPVRTTVGSQLIGSLVEVDVIAQQPTGPTASTSDSARVLEAKLRDVGIVPVVQLSQPADAIPLAEALLRAGLPCMEITFRTDAAAEAIGLVRSRIPEMLVGAGTVLTAAQADAASVAGAAFVVAPGLNPRVIAHCLARGITIVPGVCTPSEIEQALSCGLQLVKFFPAAPAGGVPYLRALAGPYPMMRFIPTGGITADNLADYLGLPTVAACGGTWLAQPDALADRDFARVEHIAREAVAVVRRVREARPTGSATVT